MTESSDTKPRRHNLRLILIIMGFSAMVSVARYLTIPAAHTPASAAEFKVGASLPEAEPVGEVPGSGGRIYKLKVPGGTLYVLEHVRNGQPGSSSMTVLKD